MSSISGLSGRSEEGQHSSSSEGAGLRDGVTDGEAAVVCEGGGVELGEVLRMGEAAGEGDRDEAGEGDGEEAGEKDGEAARVAVTLALVVADGVVDGDAPLVRDGVGDTDHDGVKDTVAEAVGGCEGTTAGETLIVGEGEGDREGGIIRESTGGGALRGKSSLGITGFVSSASFLGPCPPPTSAFSSSCPSSSWFPSSVGVKGVAGVRCWLEEPGDDGAPPGV